MDIKTDRPSNFEFGKWRDLNSQLLEEQQFYELPVKPSDNTPSAAKRGLYSGMPSRQ